MNHNIKYTDNTYLAIFFLSINLMPSLVIFFICFAARDNTECRRCVVGLNVGLLLLPLPKMKLPWATILLLVDVDNTLMIIITSIDEIDSDISHIIDGLVCLSAAACIIKSPLLGLVSGLVVRVVTAVLCCVGVNKDT